MPSTPQLGRSSSASGSASPRPGSGPRTRTDALAFSRRAHGCGDAASQHSIAPRLIDHRARDRWTGSTRSSPSSPEGHTPGFAPPAVLSCEHRAHSAPRAADPGKPRMRSTTAAVLVQAQHVIPRSAPSYCTRSPHRSAADDRRPKSKASTCNMHNASAASSCGTRSPFPAPAPFGPASMSAPYLSRAAHNTKQKVEDDLRCAPRSHVVLPAAQAASLLRTRSHALRLTAQERMPPTLRAARMKFSARSAAASRCTRSAPSPDTPPRQHHRQQTP